MVTLATIGHLTLAQTCPHSSFPGQSFFDEVEPSCRPRPHSSPSTDFESSHSAMQSLVWLVSLALAAVRTALSVRAATS